jgi:hypothetical protein
VSTAIDASKQEHLDEAELYRAKAEASIHDQKFDRVAAYAAMASLHLLAANGKTNR